MFGKYRIVIIIAVILGIAFLVYAMARKPAESDDLLLGDTAKPRSEILGAEIINALNQIESLRLSREIFSDPVFLSLTDRSREITPEPVGKKNPFDPISSKTPSTPAAPEVQTEAVPRNSIIRPPAQPVI